MWWFKKEKTNYTGEMREVLKTYMLDYIKKNPLAADDVVPIFSNAEAMIRQLSEKEVVQMMHANHVNVECGTLNILQNHAMTQIRQQNPADYIKGISTDYAHELYKHINEMKFKKGYISKQQYEENDLLGTQLALKSPFNNWL